MSRLKELIKGSYLYQKAHPQEGERKFDGFPEDLKRAMLFGSVEEYQKARMVIDFLERNGRCIILNQATLEHIWDIRALLGLKERGC